MAVPTFLNAPFRSSKITITDVADIITNLRSELAALDDPWTEPVSGTFKSPARADGAFFTVTVAAISTTRISYVVKDHQGLQVNNDTDTRQDIKASGTTDVYIYTSPFYVIIDSAGATAGVPECWGAGIACREPEPLAVPRPCYWASRGPRHASGSYPLTYNGWWYTWYLSVGATAYATDSYGILNLRSKPVNYYIDRFSMSGTLMFISMEMAAGAYLLGRRFNTLISDGIQPDQSEWTVPLDSETLGTFRVLGWGVLGLGSFIHYEQKVYIRIA
jgi:hypothetical protein